MTADERRLAAARVVADYWREAMVNLGERYPHLAGMAHPLCMVLAALDGETDPIELGVAPTSPVAGTLRSLRAAQ